MACARVSYSPGLLVIIFNELERDDLVFPSLVCRAWNAVAQDVIWRQVEEPLEIFSLIAPLGIVQGRQDFIRTPSYLDWQRFQPIARRVRSLTLTLKCSSPDTDLSHLLQVLRLTCPREYVLPHLEELTWYNHVEPRGHPELICVFLTGTLKSLRIFTPTGGPRYSVDALCDDISGRCSNLESLYIEPVKNGTTCEAGLIRLLQQLPLKSIHLPIYFLTPRALAATASCKRLRILDVCVNRSDQTHNWYHARGFPGILPSAFSFGVLQTLNLAIPLVEFNSIISRDPSHLQSTQHLSIRAVGMTRRDAIHQFCKLMSKRCVCLRELLLVTNRPTRETRQSHWEKTSASEAITFDTLMPLSQLDTLTYLEIGHEHPISVTDDELLAIMTSLPRLQVLLMNDCPPNVARSSLTMECLPHLAQVLPDLKELGVYLDLSQKVPCGPSPHQFQSLSLFYPHHSPVKNGHEEDVALFITTLLPLGGRIADADAEDYPDRSYDVLFPQPPTAGVWRKIRGQVDLIMRGREWNAGFI